VHVACLENYIEVNGWGLINWFSMILASCAQRSGFGAPWLIQYLFTEVQTD
jgi:hypothetical protein